MKRIDLIKYGFTRVKEEDFSDDGNRFTCYRVGRVLVSKLVSNGNLFIAGRLEGNKLSYEEYSKLPHYKNMNDLNYISLSQVTEDDIQKFYEDCKSYQAEYTKAEKETVMPTYEELLEVYTKIKEARIKEYNDILSKVTIPMMCQLKDYKLKNFISCFNSLKYQSELNIEHSAKMNLGTAYSKSLVGSKNVKDSCSPSFDYKEILELVNLIN